MLEPYGDLFIQMSGDSRESSIETIGVGAPLPGLFLWLGFLSLASAGSSGCYMEAQGATARFRLCKAYGTSPRYSDVKAVTGLPGSREQCVGAPSEWEDHERIRAMF